MLPITNLIIMLNILISASAVVLTDTIYIEKLAFAPDFVRVVLNHFRVMYDVRVLIRLTTSALLKEALPPITSRMVPCPLADRDM